MAVPSQLCIGSTHLGSNERLLLVLDLRLRCRSSRLNRSPEVLLRGRREIRLLERASRLADRGGRLRGGRRSIGLATTEHLLRLGGVVAHKLLGHLGGVGRVRTSNFLELLGLSADDVLRVLEVSVDQLLVGGVDERNSEEQGGSKQGKTPVWDDLNEPVREEGADGDLCCILN